jgi:hypothetical protein
MKYKDTATAALRLLSRACVRAQMVAGAGIVSRCLVSTQVYQVVLNDMRQPMNMAATFAS